VSAITDRGCDRFWCESFEFTEQSIGRTCPRRYGDLQSRREGEELYTAGTGNGQRVPIAVNECGVSCKIRVLNLGQGDRKASDYLKVNPTRRIPILIE